MPITSTLTRGWAAMARASKIAVGVSTMAHTVVDDAPAESSRVTMSSTCAAPATLGTTTDGAPAPAAAAMSSVPQGVARPLHRSASCREP